MSEAAKRSVGKCRRDESGAATPPEDTEAALRAELERLKAENRELKRRRRYKSDAAPSTRARRQRRVANYAEDPDFEP